MRRGGKAKGWGQWNRRGAGGWSGSGLPLQSHSPAHRSAARARERQLEELPSAQARARMLCQQNLQVILPQLLACGDGQGPGGREGVRGAGEPLQQGFRAAGSPLLTFSITHWLPWLRRSLPQHGAARSLHGLLVPGEPFPAVTAQRENVFCVVHDEMVRRLCSFTETSCQLLKIRKFHM